MFQRLHRLDRAILIVALPLWLMLYVLTVQESLGDAGIPSFRITLWQRSEELPRVVSIATLVDVAGSGLRVGDPVVSVAETNLRGANGLTYFFAFLAETRDHAVVPVVVERDGRRVELQIPRLPISMMRPLVVIGPIFVLVGLAILFKAPRRLLPRSFFHLFITAALLLTGYQTGPGWIPKLSVAVVFIASLLVGPLVIRAALLFPSGVAPTSLVLRLLPYPFALAGMSHLAISLGFPYSIRYSEAIGGAMQAIFMATALMLLYRAYAASDPVARRQLKLSLFGLYCAVVPGVLGGLWVIASPEDWEAMLVALSAIGLVPPFVYLALYRYDLFDVDHLLSTTAAYNIALVLLAGLGLYLVPRIGSVASDWFGVSASAGQLATCLGLAALAIPAQQRIRPRLEAMLFKRQHDLESELETLGEDLAGAEHAKALIERLGRELHDRVQPESTVVYGRDGERFVALFVEGRAAAAELESDGPVVATLRAQRGPLCLDGELAGRGARTEDPFARAALDVLNAAVVVPIRGAGDALVTFVLLGPKRSRDLYTANEVLLLRSVADRTALELQRFGEEQLRRESQSMQQAMRRYVPGTVAEHIERGEQLESSEREVTVLFVDMRGYTSLSEHSTDREIFSTVNAYTLAVSERVRDAGGTVVEFNGDGMMAVFGAPGDLPDKERAAVRTALRITADVDKMDHLGEPISVGVGIATGTAFVGDIQAADRLIWSAIGNTTNLAARLQMLTREFDTAVIIDSPTHSMLAENASRFERYEDVPIRGRSQAVDVFVLQRRREGA